MPPRKTLKQWTKERDAAGGVTPDLVAEYRDDVERLDATYFAREARGVARRDLDHAGTRLRWATQYPASKNMWDELPDELVVLIFLSLSFEKLMAGLRVCTRWRRLIKGTPRLWTRMAAKRWVMYTRSQGTPRLLPTATALGAVDSMVPCADNTIVATRVVHDGPWSVCRLDPKTGKVLWKKSDRVTRVGKLYGGGDTVYDFDDCTGAVHRWDVATGKSAVVRPPAVYGTAERKTTRTAAIAVNAPLAPQKRLGGISSSAMRYTSNSRPVRFRLGPGPGVSFTVAVKVPATIRSGLPYDTMVMLPVSRL